MKKQLAPMTLLLLMALVACGAPIKSTKVLLDEPGITSNPKQANNPPKIITKDAASPNFALQPISPTRFASQGKSQKILLQHSIYPFFPDNDAVPYSLKIQLEKILPQIKNLLAQPKSLLIIQGYASSAGKTRENQQLSAWRAYAAGRYLIWKGKLPKNKIRYQAMGELAKKGSSARKVRLLVIRK